MVRLGGPLGGGAAHHAPHVYVEIYDQEEFEGILGLRIHESGESAESVVC